MISNYHSHRYNDYYLLRYTTANLDQLLCEKFNNVNNKLYSINVNNCLNNIAIHSWTIELKDNQITQLIQTKFETIIM